LPFVNDRRGRHRRTCEPCSRLLLPSHDHLDPALQRSFIQQARAQPVPLLRFPQVRFRERALAEYEVTADDKAVLQALGSKPGWSLAAGR
jgi:hypothetical protein